MLRLKRLKEYFLEENEHKTIIVFNDGSNSCAFNLQAVLKKGSVLNIYNVATTDKTASLNETTLDILNNIMKEPEVIKINEEPINPNIINKL